VTAFRLLCAMNFALSERPEIARGFRRVAFGVQSSSSREDILLVFGGDESLELFEPVEDDVDARGYRSELAADHEKARAVTGHVVFGSPTDGSGREVVPVEKRPGDSKLETRIGGDIHRQERTTMAVKKLLAVRRPQRLRAALGRELPPVSGARIALDVHFFTPRLIGHIGWLGRLLLVPGPASND